MYCFTTEVLRLSLERKLPGGMCLKGEAFVEEVTGLMYYTTPFCVQVAEFDPNGHEMALLFFYMNS